MVKYIIKNLKYIIPALIILALLINWQYDRSMRTKEILAGPHVQIGKALIAIEVADSPGEQYRGLSGRSSLPKDAGMLFVFQNKLQRKFVMREMNFPLDIIWISDKKIVKIDANLPPEGKNPEVAYSSGTEITHVLEVNGGIAKKKGIEVGDEVEISL